MRRFSRRSTRLIVAVFLILLPSRGSAESAAPDDATNRGVRALHQGLYGRAEELFREAARGAPDDPEPQLFIAFTRWWRLVLEDPRGGEQGAPFDAAIDAALALGERRMEASPGDARAMAWTGAAHILRSHVEAMRRSYFHAAQEARRGKRLLEAALKLEPGLQEALFPLGALNYYADRVPALVKGIRAILFLPGGDADLGLQQLRAVSSSKTLFRTDAQILLALVCGSREEACFDDALRWLRQALGENPGSPLILGLLGEIQMQLGAYEDAALSFDQGLAGSAGADPDRVRQRRALRIALAEALVADWRLNRAGHVLSEADLEAGPAPQGVRRTRARTDRELVLKRGEAPLDPVDGGDPGGGLLSAALKAQEEGRLAAALALASDAATARQDLLLARFLKGRILFLSGRFEEADSELADVERRMKDPPPWLEGWTDLYRGMAERRLGRRRAARGHFRQASEVRRFRSAERGLLEMRSGEPANPRCAM